MNTIESAPKDGTPIIVWHKKFGAHFMRWSVKNKRWEGVEFTPMRVIRTWWDENEEQPTHWEMPAL